MSALPPGSTLGRFQISGVLGEGAMGVVYLAHDPHIDRPVAIKTLRGAGVASGHTGEVQSRFMKEAKLAGRLQHPNIVTIYEVGQDREVFFIAMEYVDGEPLTRFLSLHPGATLSERTGLIRQVALALQHAHERGVLHRDIKPGNILVASDWRVKVADFGIGKLLSGTGDLTRTGQMVGSPAYMSPEQIRGEKLDGRSDFFSLGVVFFEVLTGARPFPGDSITTLVYQILHTEHRDPLAVRSDLPASARELFARLLAKSPDKRPANAGEFLAEIRAIEKDLEGTDETRAMRPTTPVRPIPSVDLRAVTDDSGSPSSVSTADRPRGLGGPQGPPPRLLGHPPRHGPAYLFGLAALVLAFAVLIAIWRRSERGKVAGQTTPVPLTLPTATATTEPGIVPLDQAAAPSPSAFPSPGPDAAADAIVGATRFSISPAATRAAPGAARGMALPTPEPAQASAGLSASQAGRSSGEGGPPSSGGSSASRGDDADIDAVYRTRRYAKFGVSPDQARIFVDGRYVGIADDWDDRGGGRELQLPNGSHRVRLELPGHRDLNLNLIVTSAADDETADIDDELERISRAPYAKLPAIAERTTGDVVFDVDPPDAALTQGGKSLGPASIFTPSSPLKLTGPAVHDFVLSAPGRQSRTVRILVAPNAGETTARVKLKLKAG